MEIPIDPHHKSDHLWKPVDIAMKIDASLVHLGTLPGASGIVRGCGEKRKQIWKKCGLINGHWMDNDDWLVVWLPSMLYFPINIGCLIFPIDSYFSEGWPNHQPDGPC